MMKMLRDLSFSKPLMTLSIVWFQFLSQGAYAESFKGLTFTNTQKWNQDYIAGLDGYSPKYVQFGDAIPIAKKKLITSKAGVKRQVLKLHGFKKLRTTQKKDQIKMEERFCTLPPGSIQLGKNPLFDRLFVSLYNEASNLGFFLKKHFNIVRPSFYDKTLSTVLEVPKHPSFPSNHSLQQHTMALFLADLFPRQGNRLLKKAASIAQNREIAGLHYPMDSESGASVAHWLYERVKKNASFAKSMTLLKKKLKRKKISELSGENYDLCTKTLSQASSY